jgi:hypothetical protein
MEGHQIMTKDGSTCDSLRGHELAGRGPGEGQAAWVAHPACLLGLAPGARLFSPAKVVPSV